MGAILTPEPGRQIFASFSGGETSAEMTLRIRDALRPRDTLLVMIANTGQEDERTLIFADRCDREYGLNMVWVEAVINPGNRKVTTHRVVTFETATRDQSLFKAMIQKYGIPNNGFPHCTRELKLRPMASYLASIGWTAGTYTTAIGIRYDELDRMDPNAKAKGYVYPLVQAKMMKHHVHAAWDARPFQLGLREHEGNCRWCWKKSLRKHLTLITEQPESYEVPRYFERIYPHAGAGEGPRKFFRGGKSTDDLFALAAQPFEPFVDRRGETPAEFGFMEPNFDADLDLGEGCSDSCEAIGVEDAPELKDVFA